MVHDVTTAFAVLVFGVAVAVFVIRAIVVILAG